MHLKKMSWYETECKKKCAVGEAECNEILSLYLRKTEKLSEEKEGMGRGRRERIEKGSREKRKETKGAELTI